MDSIATGGRGGVMAIVTSAMFLVALVAAPLVLVGAMTMARAADIRWRNPEAAIPESFSIASGLAFGFVA